MAKFDLLGPKSAPRKVPNLLEGGMPVGVPICSAKPFPHRISLASHLCGLSFGLRGFDVEAVVEFE
jgi:hypothetical protein